MACSGVLETLGRVKVGEEWGNFPFTAVRHAGVGRRWGRCWGSRRVGVRSWVLALNS